MSQVGGAKRPARVGRRGFLAGAAALTSGAFIVGCAAPDRESQVQSLPLSPEQALPGQDLWFATRSASSAGGIGVVVRTVDGRAKKVEGNAAFPVNVGKLDARGQAAVQTLYHPDRLTAPLRRTGLRGSGKYEPIGWDVALRLLVGKLSGAAGRFALITSPLGGTLAEVAAAFVQGLNGATFVYEPFERTAYRQAFRQVLGSEITPYLDLANARSVLSFGADLLGTFGSPVHYGVGYGQMRHGAGRTRGAWIQVEPRMSLTGANADRWVPVRPGQEGALALSIAQVMVAEGLTGSRAWYDELAAVGGLAAINAYAPDKVTERVGVAVETIQTIAREFAANQPGIAIAGGPSLAHTNGLDVGAAVLMLNRIAGSVGKSGGIRPNPRTLAGLPAPSAPTPFAEFAEFVATLRSAERPEVLLVYDADPAYGLPATLQFARAAANVPYIVGVSTFMNDTTGLADLLLPATHPFEEWGDYAPDPAPGRTVVGYQQPVVTPWTQSRSFGDLLLEVAPQVGVTLPQATMLQAVRTTAEARFGRPNEPFERIWIDLLRKGGAWDFPAPASEFRPRADWHIGLLAEPQFEGDPIEYPLHLIPFESVGLGFAGEAEAPWLQATPDPLTTVTWQTWVELNPQTAAGLKIKSGDVVEVATPTGTLRAAAYLSPVTPPHVVGIPVGQGHRHGGRWNANRGANVMSVLTPLADAGTGAFAWAATRARVRRTGDFRRLPTLEYLENSRNDVADAPVQVTRE
ncbi:MAG: molybdopterin-dependent oxidoreductase [Actinobacteria bacterium]|nr:molybdopterin-dependent oxidoreductase [Actinomycetota bacterium]